MEAWAYSQGGLEMPVEKAERCSNLDPQNVCVVVFSSRRDELCLSKDGQPGRGAACNSNGLSFQQQISRPSQEEKVEEKIEEEKAEKTEKKEEEKRDEEEKDEKEESKENIKEKEKIEVQPEESEEREPTAPRGRKTANSQGRRKGRVTRSMTNEAAAANAAAAAAAEEPPPPLPPPPEPCKLKGCVCVSRERSRDHLGQSWFVATCLLANPVSGCSDLGFPN
ncbi:nuclear receptor corepressor 1-like, partial [Notechis scutatus]|uniref:Nuclear receptor corepressor 1-like n=1 Tax=Notechis scutatus TaxID=8663 RepID=A0A6J1VXR3_9SAUR